MENKEINFDYPVFKDHVFLYTNGEGDKMFTIFNKFFLNEFCKNFTTKVIDKIVLINEGESVRIPYILNLYISENPVVHLQGRMKPPVLKLISQLHPTTFILDYKHPSYQEWDEIILPKIIEVIGRNRFKEIHDNLIELIEEYDHYRFNNYERNFKCL